MDDLQASPDLELHLSLHNHSQDLGNIELQSKMMWDPKDKG